MAVWNRLRRPDWLAEMQSVLVAILLVAAAIAVLAAIDLARGGPLEVTVLQHDTVPGVAVPGLAPGVHLPDGGAVDVLIQHPTTEQLAWSAARSLPTYLVVVFIMIMLLRVVHAARRDDPFAATTVRRLRVTGAVVLVTGPLAGVAQLIALLALTASVTTGPPGTQTELTWWWLPVGFGLLAIAEVINRGRAMRAELAEVI